MKLFESSFKKQKWNVPMNIKIKRESNKTLLNCNEFTIYSGQTQSQFKKCTGKQYKIRDKNFVSSIFQLYIRFVLYLMKLCR